MGISTTDKRYVCHASGARTEPKRQFPWRQFIVATLALGLACCAAIQGEESTVPRGTVGFVQGTLGGIATDEPRATLIGRDVLASGGSATDAAVAAFFAMTVTLPSSVSLGGGGLCLVRDHLTETVSTLDFRGQASKSANGDLDTAAIPGNPRGIFALHAKYGNLKWAELIRPAENLARFGTEVSRALGQDLKISAADIWPDKDMRRLFSRTDASLPFAEGEFIKQENLSTTLARIRARGASDLYTGTYARQFAEAAQESGPAFTYDELRSYLPEWRQTIEVPFIKGTAFHFPMPPGLSGRTAAQITAMVAYRDWFATMTAIERAHLLAESIERTLADRPRWRSENIEPGKIVTMDATDRLLAGFDREKHVPTPSQVAAPTDSLAKSRGASLAVMDHQGSAVACAFTMNKPFGVGRVARGTGVVLAAPPATPDGDGSLAAVMLVNKIGNSMFYASAASGGAPATSALVNVMANGIANPEGNLESAMAGKRIHHGGADGTTYLEKGIDMEIVEGLGKRGHKMAYVRTLGYVNSVICVNGIPSKTGANCDVQSDPRGFGLGVGSE